VSEFILYVYIFALFSTVGWILEFCFRSIQHRKLVNPGFLGGPYLPLYGVCVLMLTFCIVYLNSSFLLPFVINIIGGAFRIGTHEYPLMYNWLMIVCKMFLYCFVTTGIELVTGFVFSRLLNRPLWDYSGESFSLGNLICLKYSLLWVALAFLYEYVVFPVVLSLVKSLNLFFLFSLGSGLCLAMFVEFCLNVSKMIEAHRLLSKVRREENYREFNQIVEPLLAREELQRLANVKHHRNKTRLDHSLDVAWLSYVISKRFSYDCVSAARGGLLHDLFDYDWATEGPRFHGLRHPSICLHNASKVADLNSRERDIIKKHMWPLTIVPPRYPEAWSVCLADTYCGVRDYLAPSQEVIK